MASPPAGWIRDLTWTTTVSCAAEAAHLVGAETHARPLLAALEPHLHLHTVLTAFGSGGSYWGALCQPAGLSAALAGDRSRAATLLTQAVDEHDRLGAGPFAERSRRALADLER
ncbi:MAG: hypothetical protein U5R31_02460 [Acidimicrobiia bacterium]|nr:hypothetical protein [Acidimicrobiia bacterium]